MKTLSWAFMLAFLLFPSMASALDQCPDNINVRILMREVKNCRELLSLDKSLTAKVRADLQSHIAKTTKEAQDVCSEEKRIKLEILKSNVMRQK
jgi:hypothetical protein